MHCLICYVLALTSPLSLVGAADVNELGLERGTADEETVNVSSSGWMSAKKLLIHIRLTLTQVRGVLAVDGATVDDTGALSDLLGDALGEEGAGVGVGLLGLLLGSDLAGADSPDGLVYKSVSLERNQRHSKD